MSLFAFSMFTDSEMMVGTQVPVTCHCVRLMVAPTKDAEPKKTANSKGKATARPTNRPRACKVTQVASPSPEAAFEDPSRVQSPSPEAPNEPPPVAGPSGSTRPPLSEEVALSGDEGVMDQDVGPLGPSSEFAVIVLSYAQLTPLLQCLGPLLY